MTPQISPTCLHNGATSGPRKTPETPYITKRAQKASTKIMETVLETPFVHTETTDVAISCFLNLFAILKKQVLIIETKRSKSMQKLAFQLFGRKIVFLFKQ